MNTNPDETTLALWLDDELQGDELAAVNAWAEQNPEQLAAREKTRRWRKMVASAVPASKEPPYAEFFNGRIARAISEPPIEPAAVATRRISWKSVLMPLAACAGMALTFWLGAETKSGTPEIDVTGAPRAIPVEPIVYTPERGVKAEWFTSSEASATVIVLNGVDAIPDTIDFSKTAATQRWREIDSTAGLENDNIPDL
jgi:anti-sigma factor RsiW